MLTSTMGARLVLMVGKFSPLPAPAILTQAIERIEVTVSAQGETGFQITFRVSKNQLGEYNLISGLSPVSLEPYSRVIIGVLMGLTTAVLIDGIITYQELSPSPQYGQATLTVSGTDLSTLLDRTELTAAYCCLPDSAIVQEILLRYLEYGIVATATPTPNVPTPSQRLVWQQGTDLEFIQMLAQRNGYIFYLESQLPMVNRAYFGPDVRLSEIQPALTMDMGANNNLLSMSFSYDGKKPMVVTGQMGIPGTAVTVPFALPSLALPPLALRPTIPARTRTLRETAKYDPMQTSSAVQSVQRAQLDSVTASGSVDAFRYGHVMRPRRLIGVRGAGFSYDGLYWVSRVTHVIERDSYTQSFALSREGLGSLTPVVRP